MVRSKIFNSSVGLLGVSAAIYAGFTNYKLILVGMFCGYMLRGMFREMLRFATRRSIVPITTQVKVKYE